MAAVAHTERRLKAQLLETFDELFALDGYASFRVEMRLLRRGQKEVIHGWPGLLLLC